MVTTAEPAPQPVSTVKRIGHEAEQFFERSTVAVTGNRAVRPLDFALLLAALVCLAWQGGVVGIVGVAVLVILLVRMVANRPLAR